MIALIEQYQQRDGTIEIPKALKSYMGGLELIDGSLNKINL